MAAVITFIDAEMAGGSARIAPTRGMTIRSLIRDRKGGDPNPNAYGVRLNNQPVTNFDQTVHPGDKVSITPKKIEGA